MGEDRASFSIDMLQDFNVDKDIGGIVTLKTYLNFIYRQYKRTDLIAYEN